MSISCSETTPWMRGEYMQSFCSTIACAVGAGNLPFMPLTSMRTNTSWSLPSFTRTALYLTSFDLQNSASLRFVGVFISGALPANLATPLMLPLPVGAASAAFGVAAAVVVAAAGVAAVGAGEGFGF